MGWVWKFLMFLVKLVLVMDWLVFICCRVWWLILRVVFLLDVLCGVLICFLLLLRLFCRNGLWLSNLRCCWFDFVVFGIFVDGMYYILFGLSRVDRFVLMVVC